MSQNLRLPFVLRAQAKHKLHKIRNSDDMVGLALQVTGPQCNRKLGLIVRARKTQK